MRLRHLLPIAIIALLCATSCRQRPKGVLSDGDMIEVLADLHIAQSYADQYPAQFATDSARKVLRQAVLQKHGITTVELDSSLSWYGRHIDRYTELYAKVEENLRKRREKVVNGKSAVMAESSAENTYPLPRMVTFSPLAASEFYTFSFPADQLEKGEGLLFKFHVLPREAGSPDFFLALEYDDKSATYTSSSLRTQNGSITAALRSDTLKSPARIYGYIRMRNNQGRYAWVDSLRLQRVPAAEVEGQGGKTYLPPSKSRGRVQAKKGEKDTVAAPVPSRSPETPAPVPVSSSRPNSVAPVDIPGRSNP